MAASTCVQWDTSCKKIKKKKRDTSCLSGKPNARVSTSWACLCVCVCVCVCAEYEGESLWSEIWIQNTCILNPDLAFSDDMIIGTEGTQVPVFVRAAKMKHHRLGGQTNQVGVFSYSSERLEVQDESVIRYGTYTQWNITQLKKEQNCGICRDVDGPRNYHTG